MLHFVDHENEHLYADPLWAMHEARRTQFVERNGWSDLVVVDGGEFDDYDDALTVYFLDLSDEGQLQAGVRVRPAATGSMLSDKFPHLVHPNWPNPTAPDVWEISRLFTTDAYRAHTPQHGEAVHRVVLAAQQVAFARGCRRFVGILDMSVYPIVSNGPQQVRLMGLPVAYAFGIMVGAEGQVSQESLSSLREALGLEPDELLPISRGGTPSSDEAALAKLRSARRKGKEAWADAAVAVQPQPLFA